MQQKNTFTSHSFTQIYNFPTYIFFSPFFHSFQSGVWQFLHETPTFVPSLVLGSLAPNPKIPASMINIKPIYH